MTRNKVYQQNISQCYTIYHNTTYNSTNEYNLSQNDIKQYKTTQSNIDQNITTNHTTTHRKMT